MSAPENPSRPVANPGVMDIAAYVPGKQGAPGVKLHKLSSNETPLGASPAAIEAYKALAATLEFYPDGSATELRKAIAEAHGLNPANMICGNGSDELLGLLCHTYLGPATRRSSPSTAFSSTRSRSWPLARSRSSRQKPTTAPMSMRSSRASRRAPGCLPRQPEQSDRHLHFRCARSAACMPACRRTCCWCSTPPMPNMSAATTTRPASNWSPSNENVVMTRTFSKIYGLAALRIGWMYAPAAHRRRAQPRARAVQLNAAAIAAGAAAIRDRRPSSDEAVASSTRSGSPADQLALTRSG